ncbi:MAG TPA: MarC family protein [Candidatus Sulfotelmatobacter sp.]|nr:MarC family protein [Candidatus Sulfotelmatobacter sp.]
MSDAVNSFFLVFAGLFPIVNPLGAAPIFLSLTRHCSTAERRSLAWRVALNGFLLLLGSVLVGSYVLEFFGITLPILRIAGGLVVTAMAWRLLNEGADSQDRRDAHAAEPAMMPDSFYPLTMPLTVGPGSIAVAITIGSQRPKLPEAIGHLALMAGAAALGLVAIAAAIYVSFRFASGITGVLGKSGTNVLVRLSAFILLCIGIGILWSGYDGLVNPSGH